MDWPFFGGDSQQRLSPRDGVRLDGGGAHAHALAGTITRVLLSFIAKAKLDPCTGMLHAEFYFVLSLRHLFYMRSTCIQTLLREDHPLQTGQHFGERRPRQHVRLVHAGLGQRQQLGLHSHQRRRRA